MEDLHDFEIQMRRREFFADRDNAQFAAASGIMSIVKPKSAFIPSTKRSDVLNSYIAAVKQAVNKDLRHLKRTKKDKTWTTSNLTPAEYKALRELQESPTIVIKPADKGGSIVVINKSNYEEKCLALLNDRQFYKPLSVSQAEQLSEHIKEEIENLAGAIDPIILEYLRKEEPRTSRFYGLPKIHKSGMPMRPIVSSNDSITENISIVIDFILKNIPPSTPSYIKDTNHFLEKIRSIVRLKAMFGW
jgi:hypothetical protein